MSVLNAIVVYFALGVPFGVLTAAFFRRRIDLQVFGEIVFNLAFWPFFLLKRAFQYPLLAIDDDFRKDEATPNLSSEGRTNRRKLRTQLALIDGLKRALNEITSGREIRTPLSGVIAHPNPEIAAKCIQRQNKERLKLKLTIAEDELRIMKSHSQNLNTESDSDITEHILSVD